MNKASRGTEHIYILQLRLLPNFFTAIVKICVLTHFDLVATDSGSNKAESYSRLSSTQYKKNPALGGRSAQINHFNILIAVDKMQA